MNTGLDLGGSRPWKLNNHVKMGGQQVGTDGGTISEVTPHTPGHSRTLQGLLTAGCPENIQPPPHYYYDNFSASD